MPQAEYVAPKGFRNELGLDDDSVVKCRDRGNKYYRNKYDTSVSQPVDNSKPSKVEQQLVIRVKEELMEAALRSAGAAVRALYVPRTKLNSILTAERILHIIDGLRGCRELSSTQRKSLASEVREGGRKWCRKPCLKLLAALIRSDAADVFYDLINGNVTDDCLPPVWNETLRGSECQSCSTRHTFLTEKTLDQKHDFHYWAYALNAPYFAKPTESGKSHTHYILSQDDVLPIVEERDVKSGSTARQRPDRTPTAENGTSGYGGFSHVRKIKFHPDHFDLNLSHRGGKQNQFLALKKLYSSDIESFNKELASLLQFQDHQKQHLIKLLVSFEIKEQRSSVFYLVFPWADGDLWKFWKINSAKETRLPLCGWMADQCLELTKALQHVHNQRDRHIRRIPSIKEAEHELYGRHGDIKAENVLWFREEGILVIADFGLGQLHTKISRSNGDPKTMEKTATYRAPEFDTPDGKISRASDIFALGCMFLEFITWYLEGFEVVNQDFPDYRGEEDMYNFITDTFFRIEETPNGKRFPVIKPKVTEWIKRLRQNRDCTNYIHDFLDLVEDRMLDPDSKTRCDSATVADKLAKMRHKLPRS
ncbi:kinase-like domain-containing protein [Xylariales sp. AK1849]|nr:kinase-like domain-containing protein [Xylariales sp. AK1849]